ncbi:MAG TPA: hypothetical protein VE029_02310, partial [Rhizobacter sp.]|nr:hypothetical protein [Rhizobacter sp.]
DRNEHAGGTEAAVGSARMRLQGSGKMAMPPPGRPTRRQPGTNPGEPDLPDPAAEPASGGAE